MTAETKTALRACLEKKWSSQDMVDWELKNTDVVVTLSSGHLLEIEKRHIETSFCFGYDSYRDEDEAEELAENARNSEAAFIRENLEWYNRYLNDLNNDRLTPYVIHTDEGLAYVTFRKWFEEVEKDNYVRLEGADLQAVIDGFTEARSHMEKRLGTYLKKYGLSKLSVWTYWRD